MADKLEAYIPTKERPNVSDAPPSVRRGFNPPVIEPADETTAYAPHQNLTDPEPPRYRTVADYKRAVLARLAAEVFQEQGQRPAEDSSRAAWARELDKQGDAEPATRADAEAPEPVAAEPKPRKPPASWKQGPRAKWDRLDPDVKDEILRREREISGYMGQSAQERSFADSIRKE